MVDKKKEIYLLISDFVNCYYNKDDLIGSKLCLAKSFRWSTAELGTIIENSDQLKLPVTKNN